MKLNLTVRLFNKNDVNTECPFEPDIDDFEMYLNSLVEDIESLDSVSSVLLNKSIIEVTLNEEVTESKFKEKISILIWRLFRTNNHCHHIHNVLLIIMDINSSII